MLLRKMQKSCVSIILVLAFLVQNLTAVASFSVYAQDEQSVFDTYSLLDYSYAGYKAGTEALPSYDNVSPEDDNVFLVAYMGEGANHLNSILNAVKEATDYIKQTGDMAVILFEPYTYSVYSTESIKIATDNIVLKGTVDSTSGSKTEIHFTDNVKNDTSADGYYITLGSYRNKSVTTDLIKGTSVNNVEFEKDGKTYNYSIPFAAKGSKDILIQRDAPLDDNTINSLLGGTMCIKQVMPSVGYWNSYIDDGIAAMKTIVYGDREDPDGKYYEICSQVRPLLEFDKSIFEYHIVNDIEYLNNENGSYIYKISIEEPLKINYIKSAVAQLFSADNGPQYKNVGIEDITFSCNWNEKFDHYTAVRTNEYYGYYGIDCVNLSDLWVKNVGFENFVQGIELDMCFRATLDNLMFFGAPAHHSVILDNSTDCLVSNVNDYGIMWHSPTATSSTAGSVFLNCEFSNQSCPDLHSATPFASLFDNCSGAFNFTHNGGTMERMPSHFDDLVFWNFDNRAGTQDDLDIWALNDGDDVYKNPTYYMTPYFIGVNGYDLTFDERDMYYYQKDVPEGIPSLYLYQLKKRDGVSQQWLSYLEDSYDDVLFYDFEDIKNFYVKDVTVNGCTLVWDRVQRKARSADSKGTIFYEISVYNSQTHSWDSFRDTNSPKEPIYYDEETDQYSTTFLFFAPESRRLMTIRPYTYNGERTIYGAYAPPVIIENDPVPAVTGLKASVTSSDSIKLSWEAIPNTTGTAYYFVYCYNEDTEKWESITNERISKTEYEVTGLNPGEIKRFKIQSVLQYDSSTVFDGPMSDEISACTVPNITGLKVTERTADSYTLEWDRCDGTVDFEYTVLKYNKALQTWEAVTDTPVKENFYTVNNAVYAENSDYRVYASYVVNGVTFNGVVSNTVTASAMPQITGYKVIDNEINGFTIVWDAIYNPDNKYVNYIVYKYDPDTDTWNSYRTTESSNSIVFDPETKTYSMNINFYAPGSETYFKIMAGVYGGENIVYTDQTPSILAKALDVPKVKGLKITGLTDNSCTLGWDEYNVTWNVYYRVYSYNPATDTYTLITGTPVKGTSYTVENISAETAQNFAVSMYYYVDGKYYEGEKSDYISARAVPQVSGFKVTDRNSKGYKLVWEDCSTESVAYSYEIYKYNEQSGIWEVDAVTDERQCEYSVDDAPFGVNVSYRIRAMLTIGETVIRGDYSTKITASAIPFVDTLKVVDHEINGYTITWQKAEAPEGAEVNYVLYKYNDATGKYDSYRNTSTAVNEYDPVTGTYSYNFSFYNPGSVTLFAVSAYVVIDGRSVYGDMCQPVAATALNVPKLDGLNAFISGNNKITLNWNEYNIKWNMFYKVYSYDEINNVYTLLTEEPVSKTSYEISDLVLGKMYNYSVSYYYYINGEYFEGEKSDVVSVCTVPEVTGFGITERTGNSYKLVWDNAGDQYYYNLYKFNWETAQWDKIADTYEQCYLIENAELGKIDKYKIEACRDYDNQTYTGKLSGELSAAAIPQVTGFEVTQNTVNGYTLVWDGAPEAAGEKVHYMLSRYYEESGWSTYRDSRISATVYFDTVTGKYSTTFTFFEPGSVQSYKVTPYVLTEENKYFYGDDSETVEARPIDVPKATGLQITKRGANSCTISWDKLDVKGYVYYRVYTFDDNGNKVLVTETPLTKNTYEITGLEAGDIADYAVSYYFYINEQYFEGELSDIISVCTVPEASGLNVLSSNAYGYTLGWDKYENSSLNVLYQLYKYNAATNTWDEFEQTLSENHAYISAEYGVSDRYKVQVLLISGEEMLGGQLSEEITAAAMENISGFETVNNDINGYTIVWKNITAPNGKPVYFSLEKYNSDNKKWEGYRDSSVSTDMIYNSETDLYSLKLYFYNPGSVTLFRLRSYVINNGAKVYSGYSDVLEAKPLEIPKATGLKITEKTDSSCTIGWDEYTAAKNMYYKLYVYDNALEQYTEACEPTKAVSYTVENIAPGETFLYRAVLCYYMNGQYFEGEMSEEVCVCTSLSQITLYMNGVAVADGESVEVGNDNSDIEFTADLIVDGLFNSGYTISVNDSAVAKSDGQSAAVMPSKAEKSTAVTVTVTSDDGQYTASYTVIINVEESKANVYVFKVDNKKLLDIENNAAYNIDTPPTYIGSKTMVPFRMLGLAVGITDLKYSSGEITFTGAGGNKIKMKIDSKDCIITDKDGNEMHITISAPVIHNGSTMLPVRDTTLLTGGTVKFVNSGHIVVTSGELNDNDINTYINRYDKI